MLGPRWACLFETSSPALEKKKKKETLSQGPQASVLPQVEEEDQTAVMMKTTNPNLMYPISGAVKYWSILLQP